MQRNSNSAGWALLGKLVFLIATIVAADQLAHCMGFEPCILSSLADLLARATGLSDAECFGLLLLAGVYISFEITRALAGVFRHR